MPVAPGKRLLAPGGPLRGWQPWLGAREPGIELPGVLQDAPFQSNGMTQDLRIAIRPVRSGDSVLVLLLGSAHSAAPSPSPPLGIVGGTGNWIRAGGVNPPASSRACEVWVGTPGNPGAREVRVVMDTPSNLLGHVLELSERPAFHAQNALNGSGVGITIPAAGPERDGWALGMVVSGQAVINEADAWDEHCPMHTSTATGATTRERIYARRAPAAAFTQLITTLGASAAWSGAVVTLDG